MKRYPVYETFHSWQGEGVHLGRSAFFIRTFGCPVHCPWCDSAGTWHRDHIPEQIARRTVEDLVGEAIQAAGDFVVITGGEPAIHDLQPLTVALRTAGLRVHLETSGAFPLRGDFDWITVSPKRWRVPMDGVLEHAAEIKLVLEKPDDLDFYWKLIARSVRCESVWLHPEWSQHRNGELLRFITSEVKKRGAPFRAGWQMHKLYSADHFDPRAQPERSLATGPEALGLTGNLR